MKTLTYVKSLVIALPFFLVFATSASLADVISTQETIHQYDRAELMRVINTEESHQQMLAMGVDPAQVNARLNSLTAAELQAFNQKLQDDPAGSGAAGVILTVFIVLVITDMLCATDIFGFVKCIN